MILSLWYAKFAKQSAISPSGTAFGRKLCVAARTGEMTVTEVTRAVFSFILLFIAALLVITFVPWLSLAILR